jgi:hypothetical protein
MNKKLQALAKKAGISVLYEYDGYDGHAAVCNLTDIEKFASLIIRKCMTQISKQTDKDDSWDDWNMGYNSGISTASETISKYFGVDK